MRIPLAAPLLVLGCAMLLTQTPAAPPVAAQAPASAPAPAAASAAPAQTHTGAIGFSYSLPAEWEVVALPPPPPPPTTPTDPALVPVKKGDACIEVELTARHGTPASVVVVMALPFDCYGQTMAATDLPGFGSGAAEGLKEAFDITDPVFGGYLLGSHSIWIERAKGSPKGHPQTQYTFEVVCTLLGKGAVCWMVMAADDAALQAFEQGAVTLDGESDGTLVPAGVLQANPLRTDQ